MIMVTKEDEAIIKGLHSKGWSTEAIAIKMGAAAKEVELVLAEVRRRETVETKKP